MYSFVTGAYSTWNYEDPTSSGYCGYTPYLFAFVLLILSWVLVKYKCIYLGTFFVAILLLHHHHRGNMKQPYMAFCILPDVKPLASRGWLLWHPI
jgi:hypothetical protein